MNDIFSIKKKRTWCGSSLIVLDRQPKTKQFCQTFPQEEFLYAYLLSKN